MSKAQEGQPTIIVIKTSGSRMFGSTFVEAEVDAAERAAGAEGMVVIRIQGDELTAAAATLPKGQVFDSGSLFTPLVASSKASRLIELGEAAGTLSRPSKPASATNPIDDPDKGAGGATNAGGDGDELAHTSTPHDWDSLTVGALCLIRENGEQEGFYYAVITAMTVADDPWDVEYSLKYTEFVPYELQTRRRDEIALLPLARPAQ